MLKTIARKGCDYIAIIVISKASRNEISGYPYTNWDKHFVDLMERALKRMHILRVCKSSGYSVSDLDYLFNPRKYTQIHTHTVVQGGGMKPLPGVFEMLQ